jgi:TolA-binding protein
MLQQLRDVPMKVTNQEYREALSILDNALPILQGLMAEDPAMKMAYSYGIYMKGLCHLELEAYGEAEEAFLTFLRGFPTHPNAMKARLLIGECYLYQENWEGIIRAIPAVIESRSALFAERTFAHQLLAEAYFQTEIWDKAKPHLAWLYKNSSEQELQFAAAGQMAVCMIRLREFEELYQVMPHLHRTDAKFDIRLNLTILEEGDEFLRDERPDLALLMFRMVVPYSALTKKIETRKFVTEERLKTLKKITSDGMGNITKQIRNLERLLEEINAETEELSAYPDYDLELRTRLGDVYYALERWEEAIQLYLSIYERSPESELAERAMYSAYMTAFNADEKIRAWEIAQKYMEAYPGGEFWDDVTLHAAGLLITLERWFETEELVDKALLESPEHAVIDNMLYMKGYAQFMQSKIDEAIVTMEKLIGDHPRSTFIIPAKYWKALGHLFNQDYAPARATFNQVVQEAQGGVLREDGFYRMGVAAYGEGDFGGSKSILDQFLSEYPDSHLASEAHAMIGDILASDARLDEAIARYQRAVDTAHVNEDGTVNMVQADYATFQLARTYELESQWQSIIDLFDSYQEKFANQKANYTEATYWKGNALKKLGKQKEALQLFYDAIVEHGNEKDAYGIDFILRDLTEEIQSSKGNIEMVVELKDRLNSEINAAIEADKKTLLLRLRGLQYMTTENEEIKALVEDLLLNEMNIPEASPYTLDMMGRVGSEKGLVDFTNKVYEHFLEEFEDSDLILHALIGLSENRIKEVRYGEAIDLLKSITDRYPTLPQAAEAYMRLGDVYRKVDETDKALETYTLILSVKEWRGELWPQALLKIGDTHAEKDEFNKAFGFYQRVYVMYLGYPEEAGEAYYKSALMLSKLGKDKEAKDTINEMLEQETLAGLPVAADARTFMLKL